MQCSGELYFFHKDASIKFFKLRIWESYLPTLNFMIPLCELKKVYKQVETYISNKLRHHVFQNNDWIGKSKKIMEVESLQANFERSWGLEFRSLSWDCVWSTEWSPTLD